MNTFYVIPNYMKASCLEYAQKISRYLTDKGKRCYIQPRSDESSGKRHIYTDASQVPSDTDVVLVLGGDGTLLHTSRDLIDLNIPLLGINMGTLGYLAEIEVSGVFEALDRLISGEYTIEERMMLSGSVHRGEENLFSDKALNDIVINRKGPLRVVDFRIYVNRAFLCSYRADGIILSTATGSTGYSLSAGGPIVSPDARLMIMTPVAPHTLNSRPIILPDDVEVSVEVGGQSMKGMEGAEVIFDGDTSMSLREGDTILVKRSSRTTRLVKINNTSFVEILRRKMN